MMSLTEHGRFVLNYSVNFVSAISLIYISKFLFRRYPISGLTLTIINCLLSGIFASIVVKFIPKVLTNNQTSTNQLQSILRMLIVSGAFAAFIISSNLSLQYNSIATYQITKLQVPPTLMLIEYIQLRLKINSPLLTEEKFRQDYSPSVLIAFGFIILGSLVQAYFDLRFHPLGITFACVSVICNALYQALVERDQRSSPYERIRFVQIQTLTSVCLLFPSWPYIDSTFEFNRFLFSRWDALTLLFVCGALAFFVNSSVIWCIKDDGAIGYNMFGQLKTLIIVLLGIVIFGESLSITQVISVLFTAAGCSFYVYVTRKTKEHYKQQQQQMASSI